MPKVAKAAHVKESKKPAGKKKDKYQMPEPLPNGEILTDLSKKQWKLGPSIGIGGFGEIYSASEVSSQTNKSYVVKIEPKENGPLFVEMHFFMKVCKSDDIESWMKSKKLKFLGLPRFVGNGSHSYNGKQYRFVVMERFGKNLDTVLKENNNIFPAHRIFEIASQIIDTLEYIHSKGYVHADIKGGNLLTGLKKGTEDKVYLVDFGLASKYGKEFKPDPKCAHNGTIEFTSRDAHVGVSTRRGDLEILAYNLLRWFTSQLPWENRLSDCEYVQQQKLKFLADVPGLLQKCFGSQPVPKVLVEYFKYVSDLAPTASPNYDLCRSLFQDGSKSKKLPSEIKVQTVSPKRALKSSTQNSEEVTSPKRALKSSTQNSEVQSPNRAPKSNTQNSKEVTSPKRALKSSTQNSKEVTSPKRALKSSTQNSEEVTSPKLSRQLRAVNKGITVSNGTIPESDSFSSDDDSDESYVPSKQSDKRKGVKRPTDNTKVRSSKRKHQ